MVLSGGAPEFHPNEVSFTINDYDFPSLGSAKTVKFRGPSWFQESSINPNLRRNITEMCEGFLEENRKQATELAEFQEKIANLENRNTWLEGRNKRFKSRIDEQSSREIIYEKNHVYYKGLSLKLHHRLVSVQSQSIQNAQYITELHDKERVLREISVRCQHLVVAADEMEKSNEQWIGRTLKLRFIFDEVKKICALPEDHAEWVMAMVESVTIPSVSVRLRNQFLPSYEDAHMEDVDSEDEADLIEELSHEAAVFSDGLGEHISEQLGQNQSIMIKHFVTIQRFYRGFMSRRSSQCLYGNNPAERTVSAIMIQKIYRGHCCRLRLASGGIQNYGPATHAMHQSLDMDDSSTDDDDDYDDDGYGYRLQLAIQMSLSTIVFDDDTVHSLTRISSLSPGDMITDDVPDYDIADMFN